MRKAWENEIERTKKITNPSVGGERMRELRESRLKAYRKSLKKADKVKVISSGDFEIFQSGSGKLIG